MDNANRKAEHSRGGDAKGILENNIFKNTKYFLIDLDGTINLDDNMIEGADEFLNKIIESGRDFYFFTNNSSNNAEVCAKRMAKIGYPVSEDKVIVSSHVTTDFLLRHRKGKTVYLLGNDRLTSDMKKAGIVLVQDNPDIVVLGLDTTLTYDKLFKASKFISTGSEYIITHPDLNCPTSSGFIPDVGSLSKVLEAATGKTPLVMGKPTTMAVDYITNKLGCTKDEIAFVGDRLETDIAIGYYHNFPTAFVLSGISTEEDLAKSDIVPSVVAQSVKDLVKYLD